MENDVFRVNLDCALLSISQVVLLTDHFVGCSIHCLVLKLSAGRPEREGLAITDLQKKLERSSAERRVADEKQSSRPTWTKSCHSLRSGKRISLALGELEEKITESERKSSELGKKDSML